MIPIDKEKHPIPNYGEMIPRYPFAEMEIGDSFTLPRKKADSVRSNAKTWAKQKDNGYEFLVRIISETESRCWRVA